MKAPSRAAPGPPWRRGRAGDSRWRWRPGDSGSCSPRPGTMACSEQHLCPSAGPAVVLHVGLSSEPPPPQPARRRDSHRRLPRDKETTKRASQRFICFIQSSSQSYVPAKLRNVCLPHAVADGCGICSRSNGWYVFSYCSEAKLSSFQIHRELFGFISQLRV